MPRPSVRLLGAVLIVALLGASGIAAGPVQAGAEPSITIEGGGWGHGVGMGQYGAEGKARKGRSAVQILRQYYTGAGVEATGPTKNVRVLTGAGTGSVEFRPLKRSRLKIRVPGSSNPPVVELRGGDVVRIGTNGAGDRIGIRVNGAKARQFQSGTRAQLSIPKGLMNVRPDVRGDFLGWSASEPSRDYRHGLIEVSVNRASREATCRARLCTVIRNLPMQKYLLGLAEVPAGFALNAQKAQAVAGRSFAALRLAAPREPGLYHLRADVYDQYYRGWAHHVGNERWARSVRDTNRWVLTYGGRIVQAFYSSSTGGYTENSDYVWTSQPGYLRAVPDATDDVSPRHRWTRRYTLAEIGQWFGVERVRNVRIEGTIGVSGRVDRASVRIIGATTRTFSGNEFRSIINAKAADRPLWSTKFRITEVVKP
jgi:stage II sporulation protein D